MRKRVKYRQFQFKLIKMQNIKKEFINKFQLKKKSTKCFIQI